MQFKWDKNKEKRNIKKHGITFDEAIGVFYDSLSATFDDPDHSIGENRFITIGFSFNGHLLVVSYVERKNTIRIISARSASASERKRHENQI